MGSSGHQQGEAEAGHQLGLEPLQNWLAKIITNLSYSYLGMRRELEFKFMPATRNDTEQQANRDDVEVRNGGMTLNEHRAENGQPLIDSPEADMPMLVAGQSVYLFTPDGVVAAGTSLDANGVQDNEPSAIEAPKPEVPDTPERTEVKKFMRFVNRGTPMRPFNFEHLDHAYAEVLNKFVEEKDLDGARWYAERYLGL